MFQNVPPGRGGGQQQPHPGFPLQEEALAIDILRVHQVQHPFVTFEGVDPAEDAPPVADGDDHAGPGSHVLCTHARHLGFRLESPSPLGREGVSLWEVRRHSGLATGGDSWQDSGCDSGEVV